MMARGPVDLRLIYDGHDLDFGRVAGGRERLTVGGDVGHDLESVGSVSFSDGPGLLPLDEALARAQTLKRQLEGAGFGLLPGAERLGDLPAFTARPSSGEENVHAADWADAARMLADDARGITEMNLYTLRTQSHMVTVALQNAQRHEREICAHSEWSSDGGRDWRLRVTIAPSLAPVAE